MVRELHGLYFAPGLRFSEVNFEDPRALATACRERINRHFIEPARMLLGSEAPFAAGLTTIAALDCLTGWTQDGLDEPPIWLPHHVADLNGPDPRRHGQTLAESFWQEVRHGLAHDGRLNRGAQFSMSIDAVAEVREGALLVNPARLLEAIAAAYDYFFLQIEQGGNEFRRFSQIVQRIHRRDLEIDRQLG